MARPVTYDDGLRDALLEATARRVDEVGIARTSLREIAEAAGTSTSAIYALFGGKQQLLGAVIADSFASFGRAQLEAEPAGLPALGHAYRSWARAHPARYRLMFSGIVPPDASPESDLASAAALDPLSRAVQARVPATDGARIQTITVAIWAQVHGAISLELAGLTEPGTDWDEIYGEIIETIAARFPPRQ